MWDDIRDMLMPMRGVEGCLQLGEGLSVFVRRLIDLDRLLGQLAAGVTVPHVYPHSVKRAEEERPLHLSTFKTRGRLAAHILQREHPSGRTKDEHRPLISGTGAAPLFGNIHMLISEDAPIGNESVRNAHTGGHPFA